MSHAILQTASTSVSVEVQSSQLRESVLTLWYQFRRTGLVSTGEAETNRSSD
jgi:hypothetical protein